MSMPEGEVDRSWRARADAPRPRPPLTDLQRKVEHRRLGGEDARSKPLLRGERDALGLLRRGGRAMNELSDMIEKVASSSSNVLIVGESGTGKELVARAVHEASTRAGGPFVALNVSTIPDGLVDSHLFGHERGAFPGAERRREGLFRAASGGTLFLDEIGELPLSVQAKLLRAVETKEILPVGSDHGLRVDVRIVAATHRDLPAMVAEARFRQDLLYRLRVVQLRLPALRERLGDVPSLAKHFVELHAKAQRKPVRAIAPDAMALLCRYPWPGNARELSNVIERAVILCSDEALTPIDLPVELGLDPAPAVALAPPPSAAVAPAKTPEESYNLERATLLFQRQHIAKVLDCSGSREAAAKLLGLSPATFYRYLQKVDLKGYQVEAHQEHHA